MADVPKKTNQTKQNLSFLKGIRTKLNAKSFVQELNSASNDNGYATVRVSKLFKDIYNRPIIGQISDCSMMLVWFCFFV